MTLNQIKYWELRWKQHKENTELQIKWHELQLAYKKLEEEKRKNRVSEAQSWHELRRKDQQMAIDAAFAYDKALQGHISLNNDQKKIAKDWYSVLSNEKVQVADFFAQLTNEQVKNNAAVLRAMASALGPAAPAAAAAWNLAESGKYDELREYMQQKFPNESYLWENTSFGKAKKQTDQSFKDAPASEETRLTNKNGHEYETYQQYKERTLSNDLKKADKTVTDITDYLSKVQGHSTTQSSSKPGFINSDKTTSGGADYYSQGGLKSESTIYAGSKDGPGFHL